MRQLKTVLGILLFVTTIGVVHAQEFPIAVGDDDTFGGGGAFDGSRFMIVLVGDSVNRFNISVQFISVNGNLSGPRISLGQAGSTPMAAFDGTNYLVTWADSFPRMANGDTSGISDIHGQFISTSGSLVGSKMTFVTGANIRFGQGRGTLDFQDTTYMMMYLKGGQPNDYLYGQRIDRSGNLVGGPIGISTGHARECAAAFDGTNYLVAWCEYAHPGLDKDIYGQLVSPSGALVGTNFLVDGGPYASDNPVTMTFDGTRFLVAFHEQAADTSGRWNLFGRFVTTSGTVAERFCICDSSTSPTFASAAFDGTDYLITWMEFAGVPRIRGRFFTASGVPVDTAFTVFDAVGNKFPVGGVSGFVNGQFLLGATMVDQNLAEGDVYGMFLPSSTTDVGSGGVSRAPIAFALEQNYPNPFNPTTHIRYILPEKQHVRLTVYDLLGRVVATLIDQTQASGSHEVMFDGSGMPSGTYFYRLRTSSFDRTRSLMLLK